MNDDAPAEPPASTSFGAGPPDGDLPEVVVRFPALYAWMAIGIGGMFFLLGLLFVLLDRRNMGSGLLLSAGSVAAVLGANYWRLHLHVVARLTPRQLILRRDGAVDWGEVVELELKTAVSYTHLRAHET